MNAVITYKEISDFIERKFKIRPKFTTIDEKSFEVSYKPGVLIPTISFKFHIETMHEDIICISYLCGKRASLIIAGIVAHLKEKIPSGIEVNATNNHIKIYLQQFKQIEKVWKHVSLSDILLGEECVNISFSIV